MVSCYSEYRSDVHITLLSCSQIRLIFSIGICLTFHAIFIHETNGSMRKAKFLSVKGQQEDINHFLDLWNDYRKFKWHQRIDFFFNVTCTILPICAHNNPEVRAKNSDLDPQDHPNFFDPILMKRFLERRDPGTTEPPNKNSSSWFG